LFAPVKGDRTDTIVEKATELGVARIRPVLTERTIVRKLNLDRLRRMEDDHGWIQTLLDESQNERMHLMTFVAIAKPNWLERLLILLAQGVFFNAFFVLYLFFPRTAHRMVGYFEEEAVISYTSYLAEIDAGRLENVPAPAIAIDYWQLAPDARLREVVLAVRADEAKHRDVNHQFAHALTA
ncbi:MAG: alternative oxidase, partial [Hyphomonadaceae bacterium]